MGPLTTLSKALGESQPKLEIVFQRGITDSDLPVKRYLLGVASVPSSLRPLNVSNSAAGSTGFTHVKSHPGRAAVLAGVFLPPAGCLGAPPPRLGLGTRSRPVVDSLHAEEFLTRDSLVGSTFTENISGDASQDYFADGMTEESVTQLGQNQGIATSSTQRAVWPTPTAAPRDVGCDDLV